LICQQRVVRQVSAKLELAFDGDAFFLQNLRQNLRQNYGFGKILRADADFLSFRLKPEN
jgi:hypothetical protein